MSRKKLPSLKFLSGKLPQCKLDYRNVILIVNEFKTTFQQNLHYSIVLWSNMPLPYHNPPHVKCVLLSTKTKTYGLDNFIKNDSLSHETQMAKLPRSIFLFSIADKKYDTRCCTLSWLGNKM
jgi:hypothetical protein